MAFSAIWVWWATIGIAYSLLLWMQFAEATLECDEVYTTFERLTDSPIRPLQRLSQWIINPQPTPIEPAQQWFLSLLNSELIQKATSGRTMLRDSICQWVTQQLQWRVQTSRWVVWVVVLIFIVISPLLSIIYRIASLLLWLALWVLVKFEVYQRKTMHIETRQLQ